MGRQCLTTVAAIAALSVCILPTVADASSTLLSGYGGPGEGNQAIIGSTLIGGSKGGGSGGSGGTSHLSAGSGSIEAPARTPGSGSGGSRAKGSSHARKPSSASKGHASGSGASAYTPAVSTAQAGGGSTLGLTGGDALYIVLALGLLALTALLTGRLTRRTGGPSEAQ
jgi:hypothetical protein